MSVAGSLAGSAAGSPSAESGRPSTAPASSTPSKPVSSLLLESIISSSVEPNDDFVGLDDSGSVVSSRSSSRASSRSGASSTGLRSASSRSTVGGSVIVASARQAILSAPALSVHALRAILQNEANNTPGISPTAAGSVCGSSFAGSPPHPNGDGSTPNESPMPEDELRRLSLAAGGTGGGGSSRLPGRMLASLGVPPVPPAAPDGRLPAAADSHSVPPSPGFPGQAPSAAMGGFDPTARARSAPSISTAGRSPVAPVSGQAQPPLPPGPAPAPDAGIAGVQGRVAALSRQPAGTRTLMLLLGQQGSPVSPAIALAFLGELLPDLWACSASGSGNYVVQRCLDGALPPVRSALLQLSLGHCTVGQVAAVIDAHLARMGSSPVAQAAVQHAGAALDSQLNAGLPAPQAPGDDRLPPLLQLALDTHGTRVAQRLVEMGVGPAEADALRTSLQRNAASVERLATDAHGCHFVLRLLECNHEALTELVTAAVAAQLLSLATGKYATVVAMRALDCAPPHVRADMCLQATRAAVLLSEDPIGNFLCSHILMQGSHAEATALAAAFRGHVLRLALSKFSSNCLERALVGGVDPAGSGSHAHQAAGSSGGAAAPVRPSRVSDDVRCDLVEEMCGLRPTEPAGGVPPIALAPSLMPAPPNPTLLGRMAADGYGVFVVCKLLPLTGSPLAIGMAMGPRQQLASAAFSAALSVVLPALAPDAPSARRLASRVLRDAPALCTYLSPALSMAAAAQGGGGGAHEGGARRGRGGFASSGHSVVSGFTGAGSYGRAQHPGAPHMARSAHGGPQPAAPGRQSGGWWPGGRQH